MGERDRKTRFFPQEFYLQSEILFQNTTHVEAHDRERLAMYISPDIQPSLNLALPCTMSFEEHEHPHKPLPLSRLPSKRGSVPNSHL
jgi:hypothetical protein